MNNYLDQVREVFFINNGETDLLTGSSAPNLFNQLVKRDIQLASRNNAQLSIISLSVCLDRFVLALGQESLRLDLEEAFHRGTPILEVLNNQVLALNKQINFNLMKLSGKSEITLLIPVVFLILPVSISFAIWPSIYGLNQAGF